jgi:predicted lipoprotein with Yx(FWY)xxD motif
MKPWILRAVLSATNHDRKENVMKTTLSLRRFATGIALGALVGIAVLAAAAYGSTSSSKGALVALRKTALGPVLVDGRGRTLYLFEKDRKGTSACNSAACVKYWPPLVSRATPRAGKGVHMSMLGVIRRKDGRRQVTYAGHPLYTFAGDKAAGQTSGEGQDAFGAEWYALAANGHSVERGEPTGGGYGG